MVDTEEMALQQALREEIAQAKYLEEFVYSLCQEVGVHSLDKLLDMVTYLQTRDDKLFRLEIYGVDNWSGYSDALEDAWREYENA